MLSIIISSANNALLSDVSKNISNTIGIPYELIAIDNSGAKRGICAVYNEGIKRAKYDVLCLMHEDLKMLTQNWGAIVIDIFNNNPDLGLLGVAGSSYKPLTPSGWHGCEAKTDYGNILQSHKFSGIGDIHYCRNPRNEKLTRVACVDGVWLCTTKSIAQQHLFDEKTFTGFHAYDVDFSLSIGQTYKVAVTYDVLMNHFSEGKYDREWLKQILKLHDKWHKHFPINIENLPKQRISKIEKDTFKNFTGQVLDWNFPVTTAVKALFREDQFFNLNPKLFFKLLFYIFKRWKKHKKGR